MGLKKYAVIAAKGLCMGAADVVPGVSGGTIAFIMGIYEELVKTIDQIGIETFTDFKKIGFKPTLKKYNLYFLIALLSGIAISILSLAKAITYLMTTQPLLLWSFFFGLVLASIWYIGKQITQWNLVVFVAIVIGTAISYYITIAKPLGSPDSLWYLIFAGFIAIIAMILPGISGAFLLLLLGVYETVLGSLTGFFEAILEGNWSLVFDNFLKIACLGIGALIGLKSFSRVLTWLFEHKKNATLAILTGFLIGSLNKLWPWKEILETRINSKGETVPFLEKSISPTQFDGDPQILAVLGLTVFGFLLILILEKWASQKTD